MTSVSEAGNSTPPSPEGRFDWKLAGTIVAGVAVLGLIAGLYLFGAQIFGLEGASAAERFIGAGRGTAWAPIVAILAFVILGLTGFPQFVMIAAAVVLFGPYYGFLYSWLGTMVSCNVGYFLGHILGSRVLRRFGGQVANQVSAMVGERGILASALVRVVPSAPFIVVNMAAGASHIRIHQFLIGTGIGIIPKTAFIAFVGGSLMSLIQELNPFVIAGLVLVLVAWVGAGYWLRRRFLGTRQANED